jgi:adenylylsulfate kinase-like enzyme
MKKKINHNKGILFWITGLSGSGKTTIAKKIFPIIKKKYGPTVILDGDKCRKALNLWGFSYEDRLSNSKKFNKITKILTDQKVNVIFSLVCLMNKPRAWNRKHIDNYLEIFIDCELKKIIKKNKKKTYKKNNNIVGVDIKPEFPKKPDILIKNDFKTNTNSLSKILLKKISNFY